MDFCGEKNRQKEMEEDVLHPILCDLPFHPGLPDHGYGLAGCLQGRQPEPDRECSAGCHGECGGPGSFVELQDVVAGDRFGTELTEEETAQCR